jgi:hypothetical protein
MKTCKWKQKTNRSKKTYPNVIKHLKIKMHCKAQGDGTQTTECEAQPPKWKILQQNTS